MSHLRVTTGRAQGTAAPVAGSCREMLRCVRGPPLGQTALSGCPRKHNPHYRAARSRQLQLQAAAVVLHDLLRDGKPQAGAVLLAMTHKRLEQFVADGGFYARTVVT